MSTERRLPTLDALRGIASLAVCWFHMTNGAPRGLLRTSGADGFMGVEAFFVISGFVIPYSLWRSGYVVTDYFRYLGKRIARLDPPYLASILVVLVLGYLSALSPGYRGRPFHIDALQVLLHLGYLNGFFGRPWLNVVYWTLAIEFEFYLLIGLVHPLVSSSDARRWIPVYGVLATLSYLFRQEQYVLAYFPVFLIGISTFKLRAGQITRQSYLVITTLLAFGIVFTFGWIIACLTGLTGLVIAFVTLDTPVLRYLGRISYSLYLVHTTVGGRVVNLGDRFAHTELARAAVSIAGVLVSIAFAHLFYLAVERPAHRWASRLKYQHGEASAGSLSPTAEGYATQ